MATMNPMRIDIDYDPDAQVWYVADTEFPGLVLEDRDLGLLISRLVSAAQDLLADDRAAVRAGPIILLPVFKVGIPIHPAQTLAG